MTPAQLRAAVARVLAARGETPDALAVRVQRASRGYLRGCPWYAVIAPPGEQCGTPPAWAAATWGATPDAACDAAWEGFIVKLRARLVDASLALTDAETRKQRSIDVLAAARRCEAEAADVERSQRPRGDE